jgi:predicted TIM-barrel fold metal-dependent hydrolase
MSKNVKGTYMSTNGSSHTGPASEFLADLSLVDHHVHGVVRDNPTAEAFSNMITESDRTPKSIEVALNSQVGFAVRRWAAPLIGAPAHISADEYFKHRISVGSEFVNSTLLKAANIGHYFLETGYRGDEIHGVEGMKAVTGSTVSEIIRIESVAEALARSGSTASTFASDFVTALAAASKNAIGLKSIVAYRIGLDFDPTRPTAQEVEAAAGRWLKEVEATGVARVADPVLIRFLIWTGADLRLPFQFHIGYGDPDLNLHKCDPLLMTDLIRAFEKLEIPILLLHTYPYQRNAGYLAQMFNNVYLDVGLAINYSGARSGAIIAETLELAPFHKILFSSDAWGLSELTFLGAHLFRRGLGRTLDSFVTDDEWSPADAIKVAKAIGHDNALAAYRL